MWFSALLPVVLGCSPSLSTMQPARLVPEGHLSLTTSADITATTGGIRDVLDEIEDMPNIDRASPAQLALAADATTTALVQAPSVGYQLSASYGLSRHFEIGIRTSVSAVRGSVRWQFLREAPGFYGALGLGVSTYLYGFPIESYTDLVDVTDFSRHEIDLPLHLGFSSRAVHVWGGPKAMLSWYNAGFSVCADERNDRCVAEALIDMDGTALYFGGQLGFAVGYGQLWFAAELTVAHVALDADLAMTYARRTVRHNYAEDGWAISPSLGLIAWF